MGTLDELRSTLGDDFFDRPSATSRTVMANWNELCLCGHIARYHSADIGGEYRVPDDEAAVIRGETWTKAVLFHGCRGALATRDFETETTVADREAMTVTMTVVPTCPCEELRPVAKVDRPNRYFNQRMPADRSDVNRHPFLIGLRAFMTHLSKRRAALADPSWAAAEFDRRFVWIEDARVCSISRCKETDGVLPAFVTDGSDRSELRCPKHR